MLCKWENFWIFIIKSAEIEFSVTLMNVLYVYLKTLFLASYKRSTLCMDHFLELGLCSFCRRFIYHIFESNSSCTFIEPRNRIHSCLFCVSKSKWILRFQVLSWLTKKNETIVSEKKIRILIVNYWERANLSNGLWFIWKCCSYSFWNHLTISNTN